MSRYWRIYNRLLQHTRQRIFRISIERNHFKVKNTLYPCINQIAKFSLVCSVIPHAKINVEDDLREAMQDGETAILDLMTELEQLVKSVSKDYRQTLKKQIELVLRLGDEASSQIIEFRTKAFELNNELTEYVILMKTIGEIVFKQTVMSMSLDSKSLEEILRKYKELEILLLQEFEQNKKVELELLEANIGAIKKA